MDHQSDIRAYIAFRYPNWKDYAEHMARVHHFEGWADDLLNDVVVDLLRKPEAKLLDMMNRRTRKIVNGAPTTELDKFVLKMLKMNASSQVAPFRKNTLGKKVIDRSNRHVEVQRTVELNGYDAELSEYNPETSNKLDRMHQVNIARMKDNGFTNEAIHYYQQHYISNRPLAEFSDREKESIFSIQTFLTTSRKTLYDRTAAHKLKNNGK